MISALNCTELFLSSPESNRLTLVSRMNHIREPFESPLWADRLTAVKQLMC